MTKMEIFIVAGVAAIVGLSVGGFIQRVRTAYDTDIIKYENLKKAPTPVPTPIEKVVQVAPEDFIAVPPVTYESYPVEFLLHQTCYAYSKDEQGGQAAYEAFYREKMSNPIKINGYSRPYLFGDISLRDFYVLHRPFYGIKAIYCPYCGNKVAWAYCVWSIRRRAPIPFLSPSKAVDFIKRQQGK